mmetsp:Transcript_17741/g.49166  ORF Transcript_17741/g.49166 Transcript_17741/m.49166 type:complete len:214 (+) Transcript_17741:156-797(+)
MMGMTRGSLNSWRLPRNPRWQPRTPSLGKSRFKNSRLRFQKGGRGRVLRWSSTTKAWLTACPQWRRLRRRRRRRRPPPAACRAGHIWMASSCIRWRRIILVFRCSAPTLGVLHPCAATSADTFSIPWGTCVMTWWGQQGHAPGVPRCPGPAGQVAVGPPCENSSTSSGLARGSPGEVNGNLARRRGHRGNVLYCALRTARACGPWLLNHIIRR